MVTSRKGRVSRNTIASNTWSSLGEVTSRKGRVSRNRISGRGMKSYIVTSRKGRVSRNWPENRSY